MKKVLAFYGRVSYNKQCQGNKTADGVWRSLVARSAGGREVAGSNPVTPISWRDMLPPLQVLAKWWEHVTCSVGKVFQNWLN